MPRHALTPLSYLDAPLDELLGHVSHVRILRVLSESGHPLAPSELARETRLTLSGVLRAVERLTRLGILRSLGVGARHLVELNPRHGVWPVLRTLFETERLRREDLVASLQKLMGSLSPAPRAAWIEGPHARGEDSARDMLRIGVLSTVRERHAITEELTPRLRDIEQRFDLSIDLLVRTRADLETLTPLQQDTIREASLLYGVLPLTEPIRHTNDEAVGPAATHADLDARSRAHGALLARAIMRDPRLIDRAKRWVHQRLQHASTAEAHELREWEHILAMPVHRISAFLEDVGERATRLRQTNPFVGVTLDAAPGDRP